MIFCPLTATVFDKKELRSEYKEAKQNGVIRLGKTCFFFRRGFKIYYITYNEIVRCFRRVMLVSTGSKKRDMQLETVVICDLKGELAQIQIPGPNAAKQLMEDMKTYAPNADLTCPDKKPEK